MVNIKPRVSCYSSNCNSVRESLVEFAVVTAVLASLSSGQPEPTATVGLWNTLVPEANRESGVEEIHRVTSQCCALPSSSTHSQRATDSEPSALRSSTVGRSDTTTY